MPSGLASELSVEPVHRSALVADRIAVVTGASSGIGRAVAIALARAAFRVCLVGRNPDRLAQTVALAQSFAPARGFQLDLTSDDQLQGVVDVLEKDAGHVDILFHGAGIIQQELLEHAHIEHFDRQYAVNVRAPYLLTQRLLPLLVKARGQIVFVNSSAGLAVNRPEVAQYAATKHAMKAIADSLRVEVNPKGVRVLSVYLGRTATPMQEALFAQEAKPYHAEELLQPEDVATMVLAALELPRTAEVTDISIRPMTKV
jgi:NADP-dependent 3-hydroxy acid dehydrogenase YdfG